MTTPSDADLEVAASDYMLGVVHVVNYGQVHPTHHITLCGSRVHRHTKYGNYVLISKYANGPTPANTCQRCLAVMVKAGDDYLV